MAKEIQVIICSDEASDEELKHIKEALELSEGWQITGDEDDDFYLVVSIKPKANWDKRRR
jgi:hypothetical protein